MIIKVLSMERVGFQDIFQSQFTCSVYKTWYVS